MKLSSSAVTFLMAVLPSVRADFDLFAEGLGGNGITGNVWGWQVYDGDFQCSDAIDWIWRSMSDVSGGKWGVRCQGACAGSDDPANIEVVEMNFNSDDLHFTVYANRDWGLYNLDDVRIGDCSPMAHQEYYCGVAVGMADTSSKIHCVTSVTDAQNIRNHRA